jgi:hypothetical protein
MTVSVEWVSMRKIDPPFIVCQCRLSSRSMWLLSRLCPTASYLNFAVIDSCFDEAAYAVPFDVA